MKIGEEHIPEYIKKGYDKDVVPLLYKKVFPLVEKYIVRNSGKKEDAFDAFQDALMIFYKQIIENVYDPKYKVYGYLYRISINKWLNKLKKESRLKFVEEIPEYTFFEEQELPDSAKKNTDENLLRTLFSSIGEKCIELLTLTIYNNLLLEDIMLRMNLSSVSAVKMQSRRCKEKLLKEIEHNPALLARLQNK